jgi:hypothetical protein
MGRPAAVNRQSSEKAVHAVKDGTVPIFYYATLGIIN